MFDESGSDYRPRTAPKITPPPVPQPVSPPPTQVTRRPLWLHITTYFLMFLFILRLTQFCFVSQTDPLTLLVNFAMTVVVGIILVGLIGTRQWGAWLFILFCAWNVISPVVVGIYRIVVMDEVIQNRTNLELLIFSEILLMVIYGGFYGFLGLWFWLKRKIFLPGRTPTEWGGVTYTVIVSIMILFTATQIAASRQYIRISEEELDKNRVWIQERW